MKYLTVLAAMAISVAHAEPLHKPWVLMMFASPHSQPATEFFDDWGACNDRLADWVDRAIRSHPAAQATIHAVKIPGSEDTYPLAIVGSFFAYCGPTTDLDFDRLPKPGVP